MSWRLRHLWSGGQSTWLRTQRSGFDSRLYQIFWEVVGLERGAPSLVSTIEELPERKSSGCCLEIREYGRRDPSRWPRGTLYPQRLQLTSPTSSGRSVGMVRSRTQATEFICCHEDTRVREYLGPLLFISALDEEEWSVSHSGHLTRAKEPPVHIEQEAEWAKKQFWTI
jgi:hypothetical protein